jgi:hypothetical protein
LRAISREGRFRKKDLKRKKGEEYARREPSQNGNKKKESHLLQTAS